MIRSYSKWQELKIIRNEVAYDYTENRIELMEKLNAIFYAKEDLEAYFEDSLIYLESRGLIKEEKG